MKTVTKLFFAFVGLPFLYAWTIQQTNDIIKAEWLVGTWENKTSKGIIYETWAKANDNEYSGMSYSIKENDTTFFENIRLVQERGVLFYIPIVKSQNSGLPIRFTSKTVSETQLVFENAKHDFPKIISYTKIRPDSLVAVISGSKNGQEQKQTFTMNRLK
jgi:hypothetical protein